MNRYVKFLLIYALVLPLITIPGVITIDAVFINGDELADRLLEDLNKKKYDVLYFGDSTVFQIGACDTGNLGTQQMLIRLSSFSIYPLLHNLYSPLIYKEYAQLITKVKHKPRLAIIPITISSFSSWFARTDSSFLTKRQYIRWLYSGKLDILEYFKYRFLKQQEQEMDTWRESSIVYGDMKLGKVKDIVQKINVGRVNFECVGGEEKYSSELSLMFKFAYMSPLKDDHRILKALSETIAKLRSEGIDTLVYTGPVNIHDGIKYVGNEFIERHNENISTIKAFLLDQNVAFLDLSTKLNPSYFVDKRYASQHLNAKGRFYVASMLSNLLKNLNMQNRF